MPEKATKLPQPVKTPDQLTLELVDQQPTLQLHGTPEIPREVVYGIADNAGYGPEPFKTETVTVPAECVHVAGSAAEGSEPVKTDLVTAVELIELGARQGC